MKKGAAKHDFGSSDVRSDPASWDEGKVSLVFERVLNEMLDLYLVVEKVHWYLRLSFSQHREVEMTREVCWIILGAIRLLASVEGRLCDDDLPRPGQVIAAIQDRLIDTDIPSWLVALQANVGQSFVEEAQ